MSHYPLFGVEDVRCSPFLSRFLRSLHISKLADTTDAHLLLCCIVISNNFVAKGVVVDMGGNGLMGLAAMLLSKDGCCRCVGRWFVI